MTAVRPSRATQQLVMSRSGAHCEVAHVCGGAYLSGVKGYDWDIHHRRPAGSGGSRLGWVHAASNLLALCRADHNRIESQRLWATELGLLVPSWGDPKAIPADCRHGRVLLDDDGTWTYATGVAS